jgi:hypothetical protein
MHALARRALSSLGRYAKQFPFAAARYVACSAIVAAVDAPAKAVQMHGRALDLAARGGMAYDVALGQVRCAALRCVCVRGFDAMMVRQLELSILSPTTHGALNATARATLTRLGAGMLLTLPGMGGSGASSDADNADGEWDTEDGAGASHAKAAEPAAFGSDAAGRCPANRLAAETVSPERARSNRIAPNRGPPGLDRASGPVVGL